MSTATFHKTVCLPCAAHRASFAIPFAHLHTDTTQLSVHAVLSIPQAFSCRTQPIAGVPTYAMLQRVLHDGSSVYDDFRRAHRGSSMAPELNYPHSSVKPELLPWVREHLGYDDIAFMLEVGERRNAASELSGECITEKRLI